MVNNISAQEAARLLAAGEAILVDVRSPEEFHSEHIAYANSLPLDSIGALFGQLKIPESRKVIFQCLKGGRGEKACVVIQEGACCGNEIYNLTGGITAWKEAGLPVITSESEGKLSIFRQVQIIVGGLVAFCVMLGMLGFSLAFMIAGFLGAALFIAGLTGWCGLAMLLSRMPWNK